MYTHITLATPGRTTLFASTELLEAGARHLARVGGERLVLFGIVDDHVHLVVSGDAPPIASGLHRSLAYLTGDLAHAHLRPVTGRAHLERLVAYFARQVRKHGLPHHPALWPGSCAPDLLGIRTLPGFDPRTIAFALPRVDVARLVADACAVAIPKPAEAVMISAHGALALWATAHAAAGLRIDAVRTPDRVAVRIAWAHLAGRHTPNVMPERTLRRLRASSPDPEWLARIARRVTIERAVRTESPAPPSRREWPDDLHESPRGRPLDLR